MNVFSLYNDYYFNEAENCFYLGDKKTKISDFFMKYREIAKKEGNKYIITLDKYKHIMDYPRDIEFIFPFEITEIDPEEKKKQRNKINIFVSSYSHIDQILLKYKDYYDFYYCVDENENFIKFLRTDLNKIYSEIKKIKLSIMKYTDIYTVNNQIINEYTELYPNHLSLSYEKYLKYSVNLQDKTNFFNLTKERKDFFELLDDKLKTNDIFLPICGPEGIGKTSSILAYCRIKIQNNYLYFNARAFSELFKENNEKEIKNMLSNELSRVVFPSNLNKEIEEIMRNKSFNCGPIEFLIKILENITCPTLLIIDQYKTALDENYKSLKNLLNKYKGSFNIILLSSMNEDDVKGSFVKVIKNEEFSKDNFFLDYLYICELAKVSDNDLKRLDKQEIQILNKFENLYSIFYEIIEFKKKNNDIFNETKFLAKINDDIKKNLRIYYKAEEKVNIYKALSKIMNIELSTLKKEEFLKVYIDFPFRYFKLIIDNKNIFRISEINNAKTFKFEYLYLQFLDIIINFTKEIYNEIQVDENISDNVKAQIIPLTLENNAFYSIWYQRKFNGDIVDKVVKVSSIHDLKKEDIDNIKIEKGKTIVGKGFILIQTNPNAKLFDFGILVHKKEGIWKLYLIQVTKKKEAIERITLPCLDDFFGFFDEFLKVNCDIKVGEHYFCYIFDNDERDNVSIKYCEERKLDYIFCKKNVSLLNYENRNLNEYKMKKTIVESMNSNFPHVEEFFIKKFYPKNKNFDETKKFLQRKRKLLEPKEFKSNNELIKRMEKKRKYYNSISQHFGKTKEIDYNEREEEVINYLVEKEFQKKNLIGIHLLIPDQNSLIKQLKDEKITENEIKNFYDLIGNSNENFKIINLKKLNYFIPSLYIPEYMTFIIIKTDENCIYLDYENKKAFILSTKCQINFLDAYKSDWKCFAISFANKYLTREITEKDTSLANIFSIKNYLE